MYCDLSGHKYCFHFLMCQNLENVEMKKVMAGLVRGEKGEKGRLDGWGGRKEKEKGKEIKCNRKSKGLGIRQLAWSLCDLGKITKTLWVNNACFSRSVFV